MALDRGSDRLWLAGCAIGDSSLARWEKDEAGVIRGRKEEEVLGPEFPLHKQVGIDRFFRITCRVRAFPVGSSADFMDLPALLRILSDSNVHLREAMRELPEDAWHQPVESPMGPSTPLEAVGRLMYHTGIHAGQISLIQKSKAKSPASSSH